MPGIAHHVDAAEVENALLRQAIERLPLGLCMFDGDDRLQLANARFAEIWGLPAALLAPGTSFAEIMAGTRGHETEESRGRPRPPPGREATRRREWRMDDGRSIEVVVTRMADVSCVAVHEDVTEQRGAAARIAWLARHDALTELPNRAVLREELARLLARNARGEDLALMVLDLDGFKAVNDTHGHPAGDRLLVQVAERLRHASRETDLVVRLGGDEFAVVQCGVPQPAAATGLARRLVAAIGEPFDLGDSHSHVGASIGIAVAPFDGEDPDTLLKNADLALYRAKADGRGTMRFFEPEMDERARARRAMEVELRHALSEGQFALEYQPQRRIADGAVTGVEALLRWHHPERGRVPPDSFIPLAEDTGLIVPIGRWVLQRACADASGWPLPLRVAVNVSAIQFRHGALLRDALDALAASGLPAERLEIEITESAMMKDAAQALALLRRLREHGIRVAIDDFGTGYSSLTTLHSFPFDRIKIDRSFVRDIERDAGSRSIVRAVAALGRSLGMETTVEGVETAEQLAIARAEGCADVQGYYHSRPLGPVAIAEYLAGAVTATAA